MDKKQRKTLSERINQSKRKLITVLICVLIAIGFIILGNPGSQSSDIDGEDVINASRAERIEEQVKNESEAGEDSGESSSSSLWNEFLAGTEKAKKKIKDGVESATSANNNDKYDNQSNQSSDDSTSKTSTGKYQLTDTESYTVEANDGGFSEDELEEGRTSFLRISELDVLGRASFSSKGSFQKSDLKNNGRPDISNIHPCGWNQAYYDTSITGSDHEALYDRGHIIAEFLSDYSDEDNFVTLTRQANLAMAEWENEIGDFLDHNPGVHVLYKVTPRFIGTEFVCRGLTLQAQSVEDGGEGLGFTVYIKNVEHGITIDYDTGESSSGEVTVKSGMILLLPSNNRRFAA